MELLSLGTKVLRDESSIIRLCDLVVYWSQYCKSSVTVNCTAPVPDQKLFGLTEVATDITDRN